MNRGRWGSSSRYPIEYQWTKKEIELITTSIVAVNASNKKAQSIWTKSEQIQGLKYKYTSEFETVISKKINNDITKLQKINNVVKKQLP